MFPVYSKKLAMIKIIESPRDGMQGLKSFIPTVKKIEYLNALLNIGFHTLDFGSFVSPQAIPQMADTAAVLNGLDLSSTKTKLLAIVANLRGGKEAASYDEIHYLGFPFSISRTFSELNINASVWKAYRTINQLLELCDKTGKELVLYISMAFGNPYGDRWNPDILNRWVDILFKRGVRIMALSDTVGIGSADNIGKAFAGVVNQFPQVEFGAHLHTTIDNWYANINAAFTNGCRRFDSVINGLGGCPMSQRKMIGNLATENLLSYFKEKNISLDIDAEAFNKAANIAAFSIAKYTSI